MSTATLDVDTDAYVDVGTAFLTADDDACDLVAAAAIAAGAGGGGGRSARLGAEPAGIGPGPAVPAPSRG